VAVALADWLPAELKNKQVPGAAAAVVDSNGVVWQAQYGVIDDDDSPAVNPDTVFCIRSISKSVTALGVLFAVQQGLLGLDEPISRYLPEFTVHSRFDKQPADKITLRKMLSHWVGFTHDPPLRLDLSQPDYFQTYIRRISETWLRFPVGYRHQYSNYGIDLAAHTLARRSCRAFADYMRDHVLLPLGMTRSTFDLHHVEQQENRAVGHTKDGDKTPVHLPEIAAAGLYASITDMARLAQFHLNRGVVDGKRLLDEALMEESHGIQFAGAHQRTGYTLGLIREAVSKTYALYHEGGGRGFGAHFLLYPELKLAVVLLTNREYHGLTGFSGRRLVNDIIVDRYGPTPAAAPTVDDNQRISPKDPRIEAVIGRYGDSPGWRIDSTVTGLQLSTGQETVFDLTFYDDRSQLVGLYGKTNEIRVLPGYADRRGSLMQIDRKVSNDNYLYLDFNDSPTDPPGPAKPHWQQYVGQYDVLFENIAYWSTRVEIRNGYLYFNDGKCEEYEPGLFFRYDGEIVDFRREPPVFANQILRRK